ncbi:hypothetical protein CNYM01_07283 [Colletotrichum nymphaeae SA-01]|uniref:F-box domain-containing protein n=1 Tax=Colletotrichum nymphaeae SA-01 TaxID=1460502 RepID=A0A135T8D1_9PEZI|nr:hypothetical protein CNYM01_07283 [Colletotrichum nymphaeae SA-01]
MSLLHLPVEVLQSIILETIPESIDNVALTCKKLYEASERYLVQHNILRRRFRHFAFDVVGSDDDERIHGTETFIVNSLDLLMKIIHHPIIAQYIQIADLRLLSATCNIKALREFLHKSPYLKEIGEDPDFWEGMIRHEALGHAEFLLLSLLTHVRELALPTNWRQLGVRGEDPSGAGNDLRTWQVLDHIVSRANERDTKDAALSKLKILRPFASSGWRSRHAMTLNTPFLAIKSLREAYIGGCVATDDGETAIPFSPEYPDYSPRLEKMELVGCTIGRGELRALLSRIPNLNSLRYAHETKWDSCGSYFDPGQALCTIMECTSETLKELSMRTMTQMGAIESTLSNMKGFKRLKYLEIDAAMLMGTEFRRDIIKEEFPYQPLCVPLYEIAAPRLVDMLPPSIKSVRILATPWDCRESDPRKTRCLRALIDGLCTERHSEGKLPRLKEVVFSALGNTIDNNFLDKYKAGWVTIPLQEGTELQPDFVPDFHERFGVPAEEYVESDEEDILLPVGNVELEDSESDEEDSESEDDQHF